MTREYLALFFLAMAVLMFLDASLVFAFKRKLTLKALSVALVCAFVFAALNQP
jgi:hypothetical protein